MADTVPHADSNIVDAIVERLYQADMDVISRSRWSVTSAPLSCSATSLIASKG